jgi:hypothetical protein
MTDTSSLSEAQILAGSCLSPATVLLLQDKVINAKEALCNVKFDADPVSREEAILAYVELQAKRNAWMELLDAHYDAMQRLAEQDAHLGK